eukprot:GFUD01115740.1.p1 GENE.GFUD01115740.1~~GFUD01115740.1.p1  ORF type:complete len:183 (-),score=49.97 GFUD01115740.1:51-599(-)
MQYTETHFQGRNLKMKQAEDFSDDKVEIGDDYNNNNNNSIYISEALSRDETCLRYSLISFVSETETDSSDIDLGDSDDADDDLTATVSESLDNESECESDSGSFVEFDTINDIDDIIHTDTGSSEFLLKDVTKSNNHILYTIVEEDENSDAQTEATVDRPATPRWHLSALQKYFILLGEEEN